MNIAREHLPQPFDAHLLQWTLATTLIFTPLAFGTVEVWSIAIAELLLLLMGVLWITRMIFEGTIQFEQTPLNAPILLLLALILFQMLPMPLTAIKYLSPSAHAVYREVESAFNSQMGWWTISLDPIATREEFLKVLTYAMLFWVVLNNFRRRKQIEWLVAIVIAMGFFLAVFGVIQNYSWNGKIYGFGN